MWATSNGIGLANQCLPMMLALFVYLLGSPVLAQDDLEFTLMADGEGKDFVYLLCSDCHSMQQVLGYRYSRAGWRSAMQRMTDEFGMAELDGEECTLVLDYLTRHYGPGSGR